MSSKDKTLLEVVGSMLRHCSRMQVAANEQIEIELRTRVEAEEFFMLVQFMATQRGFEFVDATAQRDWLRTAVGGIKHRTTCDVESNRPLFNVKKRTMLAERAQFNAGNFKMRVDAAQETYLDATTTDDCGDGFRRKERRSFRHTSAPLWRIDMTRVVYCSHGSMREEHGDVQYEMEIEFLRDASSNSANIDTGVAMTQLRGLLTLLVGTAQ